MSEKRAKAILLTAIVWLVIAGALGVAYKLLIHPKSKEKLTAQTGSESRYTEEIVVAADSFSGYCLLRSEEIRRELGSHGVRLTIQDDQADYEARMEALRAGDVHMAVFTIDSFIQSCAKLGEFPATIVLVIDETKGADAIVADKEAVGSIQDLDHPDARIVLTPNSPSEFLARTVIAHFNLPELPPDWWIEADGAADVFERFRKDRGRQRRAYVLWEPYVSRALEQSNAHVLLDSSKLRGYIVDVLVAQRKFLRDRPELVQTLLAAYLRAAYTYQQEPDGMTALVRQDAEDGGTRLSAAQADKLVAGIWWKNTLENYAHFGLLPAGDTRGLQHLEDMIANIADVLVKTGAVERDPVGEAASTLYHDRILSRLQAEHFHPGRKLSILQGAEDAASAPEAVREAVELRELSDAEWDSLLEVGQMRVKPIQFARGTAGINVQSERELRDLATRLQSWPQYYLIVVGHARAEGDAEANLRLAQQRADTVREYLVQLGTGAKRIRARAAAPSRQNGAAQSVSFVVGQRPY